MTLLLNDYKFINTIQKYLDGTADDIKIFYPLIINRVTEKPAEITLQVKSVTDKIKVSHFDNGGQSIQLYVKPVDEFDFVQFKSLMDLPEFGFLKDWSTKTVLDNSGNFNIKLRTDEDGTDWKFANNLECLPGNVVKEPLTKGQVLKAVLHPGAWFNAKEKKYGLYFSLQELTKL